MNILIPIIFNFFCLILMSVALYFAWLASKRHIENVLRVKTSAFKRQQKEFKAYRAETDAKLNFLENLSRREAKNLNLPQNPFNKSELRHIEQQKTKVLAVAGEPIEN